MEDFELIIDDKYTSVNISKSSMYMVLSKSNKTILFNFVNNKNICEISLKNVRYSIFSKNEDFLILGKINSIAIVSLNDFSIIKTLRTGESKAKCILIDDKLMYSNTDKEFNTSIIMYNIYNGQKQYLSKKSHSIVWSFYYDNGHICVIEEAPNSDIFTLSKFNIEAKSIIKYSFNIPRHGLNTVAYSNYVHGIIALVKTADKQKTYTLFIIEPYSGKTKNIKEFNDSKLILELKIKDNLLFIEKFSNIEILDLTTEEEFYINSFPMPFVDFCDNPDYFTIFNGEFTSLYKIIHSHLEDGSVIDG